MTERQVYTLNTGAEGVEGGRLARQHGNLVKWTNGLAPDMILKHLGSKCGCRVPAVADICTGTGIWLRDMASVLSSEARLDGYDIDTSKFLEPASLPSNVKLVYGDAMKPFPEDAIGAYDLVHVRLVHYALRMDEWEKIGANLRTLLKPGGYLMWDESGLQWFQCIPLNEQFLKWMTVEASYAVAVGRDLFAPTRLKQQLEGCGYVNCTQQDFNSFGLPDDLRKTCGAMLVAAGAQSLHGIVDGGGREGLRTHEEVDELMNALHEDNANGDINIGWTMTWVIGQNPE